MYHDTAVERAHIFASLPTVFPPHHLSFRGMAAHRPAHAMMIRKSVAQRASLTPAHNIILAKYGYTRAQSVTKKKLGDTNTISREIAQHIKLAFETKT